MSGTLILKNGLMAAVCVAGLTLTACASSSGAYGNSDSRYGGVYDYESGGSDCNVNPCGPVVAPPVSSRYGSETVIGGQAVSPGVVYADCSVVGNMNCNQPAPVYAPPAYAPALPVACPAGTTPSGNGTCMEPYSSPPSMSYSSPPSMSYSAHTPAYSGERAPCPAGTTPNGDGTCMEGSAAPYSSPPSMSHTYSGKMADCPTGTTANGDGTCREGSGGRVEIYGHGGYQHPPTHNPPIDYLPIRK